MTGTSVEGSYTPQGQAERRIRATSTGWSIEGNWYEVGLPEGGRSGSFTAGLTPQKHRLDVNFYENQKLIESAAWTCGPIPPPPTPDITPEPLPTPTPLPTATPIRDDQDIDNFQTFDSLTPPQQVAVLTKRGPRQRTEYTADDLSMRVLVKGGWPVLLDYGLESDAPADLSIEVEGERAVHRRLEPSDRNQIGITLPGHFGSEPQVAKLHIQALTSDGQPADFQLFGLAMGDRGVQALRRTNQSATEVQLAMNNSPPGSAYERLALFAPALQSGSSIQITVTLPNTIKVKQKPKNEIEFSCMSRADFSEARWEWWRISGLNWKKVWQHGTGSLSRNQTKSETWDGIISSRKLVSAGAHALQLTAWQKAGSDRDWVVARAPSRLTVIE
jgi:hypothetical protein